MKINLSRLKPGSISIRIVLFSILVTLVPSIGMSWFWLDISRKVTTEKVEQKLTASAGLIEREIRLWLRERNYDMRVFSSSSVIAESLKKNLLTTTEKKSADFDNNYLKTIQTYLGLLTKQFPEYNRLIVLDKDRRLLAESEYLEHDQHPLLPTNWKEQVIRFGYFINDEHVMHSDNNPLLLIGIPLLIGQDKKQIGFFLMEVQLNSLLSTLIRSLPAGDEPSGYFTMRLVRRDTGRFIIGHVPNEKRDEPIMISAESMQLFRNPKKLHTYVNDYKRQVVGLAVAFSDLPWGVIIEQKYNEVYSGLTDARDRIILIGTLLTILIGGAAMIMASQIIIPLKALTKGVLRVTNGDLDFSVPVRTHDELGLVTATFNEMVARLRKGQEKLRIMALTDYLTGLANRKQVMTELEQHLERNRRYGTEFSILLLDIDRFKAINDTYGHQAGDHVLTQLSDIFRKTLRTLDIAGRYGGEEFLILLSMTGLSRALQTAERLRIAVEQSAFIWEKKQIEVTISIGVAAVSDADKDINDLIGRVDEALYQAKSKGRNRVVLHSCQQ